MENTLEQKRAEARKFKGVSYDARTGKYTSEIVVRGERRYLGSFDTAPQAADAYLAVRSDEPVERRAAETNTFEIAFSKFLEGCQRTEPYNNIATGEVFVAPDGQQYRVVGVEFYRKKGSKSKRVAWMFYRWETHCRVCGLPFITKTTVRAKTVTGMTRNCLAHRGQRDVGEHVKKPMFWAEPVVPEENVVPGPPENERGKRIYYWRRIHMQRTGQAWAESGDAYVKAALAGLRLEQTSEEAAATFAAAESLV